MVSLFFVLAWGVEKKNDMTLVHVVTFAAA